MRALFVTVRMKPDYRDEILKGALEDGCVGQPNGGLPSRTSFLRDIASS